MKKVFIDGSAGTTGLRIAERLAQRTDVEFLLLPEALRKDESARRDCLNRADIVFLCLPDEAAKQAVGMVENPDTAVIDTSTAHRTDGAFVYGFAELTGRREAIRTSKRIANPGCHAGGVIALVAPLVEKGLLSPQTRLSCFSLTGYSGGGKKMITEYESEARDPLFDAPRMYGIGQNHKHLPEIQKECRLEAVPIFCPVVAPYYAGMQVTVPLFREELGGSVGDVKALYRDYYRTGLVHYEENTEAFLSAGEFSGCDGMQICIGGNEERILLISRFDNLGKGASGSALQNMNIILGVEESCGLCLREKE